MFKRVIAQLDDFFFRVILRNLLKLSKLGYGVVVTGAERGENYEHMYNNRPEGTLLIGKLVDRILLNLPAVQATRGRKDDIKRLVWNEIHRNKYLGIKTRILDIASGGARYLRELKEEHQGGYVESICVDRDKECVVMGRSFCNKEMMANIKFLRGDVFKSEHLKHLGRQNNWRPNIVIASGFFIYFNNDDVEKMLSEIYGLLDGKGAVIFSSYETLHTKKLMRKTMSTSDGADWTLYYRKPDYWYSILNKLGYQDALILRDQWQTNNICLGRKPGKESSFK